MKVLGAIGIVRALVALIFGVILIARAGQLAVRDYIADRGALESLHADDEDKANFDFDRTALSVVGGGCVVLAALRLVQGVGALYTARWARSCGLGLAAFDVLNLALFPLSTALGLYGLVVYRHAETGERFRAKRATVSGAG